MRIIAGAWRGRVLRGPAEATRPTADRVRQAVFDMLAHSAWGGRTVLDGARVLDLFAGTGAMGLEALSRGAAHATFVESNRAAVSVLRLNIASCKAESMADVIAADVLALAAGPPSSVVFLDPPYGKGLVNTALARLRATGRLAPGALVVAETGRDERAPVADSLAERTHGAARITIWRPDVLDQQATEIT